MKLPLDTAMQVVFLFPHLHSGIKNDLCQGWSLTSWKPASPLSCLAFAGLYKPWGAMQRMLHIPFSWLVSAWLHRPWGERPGKMNPLILYWPLLGQLCPGLPGDESFPHSVAGLYPIFHDWSLQSLQGRGICIPSFIDSFPMVSGQKNCAASLTVGLPLTGQSLWSRGSCFLLFQGKPL